MKSADVAPNPAHAAILRAIAAIPVGCVASYGEIARRAGLPRRARLVARVLAQLPAEPGVPWHRVLRADGRIAFAPGTRGYKEQIKRLASEGVRCRAGHVESANLDGADADLDRLLWEH